MPLKDPVAKRLYMREYLRKRREDPEFRKRANQLTMESRKRVPDGDKKHAEANARYKLKYPDRVKATMRRVDAQPHRVASRPVRREKWRAGVEDAAFRAFEKNWRIARKLRINENGGSCTLDQWLDRCRLYGNCCAYCTTSLEHKAEMDHIIAVAKGGTGWPSNLAPACRSCNARKNTARWRPKLPKPTSGYFTKVAGIEREVSSYGL